MEDDNIEEDENKDDNSSEDSNTSDSTIDSDTEEEDIENVFSEDISSLESDDDIDIINESSEDITEDISDVDLDEHEFDVEDTKSGSRGKEGISDTVAKNLIDDDEKDFHDGILENSKIVEEYDLNEFSKIQILHNPYINEDLYRVVEPELSDFEKVLRYRVSKDVEEEFEKLPVENMTEDEIRDEIEDLALKHLNKQKSLISSYGEKFFSKIQVAYEFILNKLPISGFDLDGVSESFQTITQDNMDRVLYYILRDYADYEKLTPLLNDENIEDISCNGPNKPVFLYHKVYQDVITNITYTESELDEFVSALAQRSGKHISIAQPDLQGRLPDGSRMQLTYSDEISDDGSNFTIRKFQEEPFTPVDLIEFGTFSLDQMAYLWLAIENDKSLIFAGGTASGKTTSMNAISLFIPPRSKVVSIEDTREITLRHSNWVKSITRESFGSDESGSVGMYQLLRDALRQRPEYIIVGEIRGEEAKTLFQAMSTGHTTYSTMHADDVESAIRRLENEPINLPRQMLNSLDILSVQLRIIEDGDVLRRTKETVEIVDVIAETNNIKTRTMFEYVPSSDNIVYKGNSNILEDIRIMNNWTDDELDDELARRKKVLNYLIEETDVRDYELVSGVLRTYMEDKKSVINKIESGDLLK